MESCTYDLTVFGPSWGYYYTNLYFRIPISGHLQLRVLFLNPVGVCLLELWLWVRSFGRTKKNDLVSRIFRICGFSVERQIQKKDL